MGAGGKVDGGGQRLACRVTCAVHDESGAIGPIQVMAGQEWATEELGTKEKFWVEDSSGQPWLFKFAEYHERVNGSDWAELGVHAVAVELGVPSACIALGRCGGHRGVLSRSVVTRDQGLVHGNEVMAGWNPGYEVQAKRENPRYTVPNVSAALSGVRATDGKAPAFDQFATYLVLDALVAGRDRHHENWAVIRQGRDPLELAPSFDHGNALGFAEQSGRASELADDAGRLRAWVAKGRSHHFAGRPTLVALAVEAVALCSSAGRNEILGKLESFSVSAVESVLRRVPEEVLSEGNRTLALRVVEVNQRRLQDELTTSLP